MKIYQSHTIIREMPPGERPREKMINQGVESLSNTELIALLLRTGGTNNSAIGLATKVLSMESESENEKQSEKNKEKGLFFLRSCIPEELQKIDGIGIAKACQIVAAVELGRRISSLPKADRISINSPQDISTYLMERMRHQKKEIFNVVILNTKHEILMIDNISVGTINSSVAYPREVFEKPMRKGGAAIILAHNHPSGNPNPSNEDIEVTKRLVQVGDLLGIQVLDHIIIGDGSFVSLKERGYM